MSLKWDHTKPEEVENARQEVERLRQAGYSFFLVTGEPADPVAAGHGEIEVRRINDPLTVHEEADPKPKRRGSRPAEGAKAVAVRPQQGG